MSRFLYKSSLKPYARKLRCNLTDCESLLWSRIRRKQILDIQFYRQKAIGKFIVDFYASKIQLVIELDGSQHFEKEHLNKDKERDRYLKGLRLEILRFDNRQIMSSLNSVLEVIYNTIRSRQGFVFQ